MIDLAALARLAEEHRDDLDRPVAPLRIAGSTYDTDTTPVLMGVVNLSRDSTYRESIAVDLPSAVRMARVQVAEGAHVIDVGAEASSPDAARAAASDQEKVLLPVVEQLADEGIAVSVESYQTSVVRSSLKAGAAVLNLSGSQDDDEMFALAGEYDAAVVLCHIHGVHARDLDAGPVDSDPIPRMLDSLGARVERARELGVTALTIDPGVGFGFPSDNPIARAGHQAVTVLNSFRLRRLGVPITHSLPHAFDLFGDRFRSGEGYFAVLAQLGGTGMYRVHEVGLVRSVLAAMRAFGVSGEAGSPADR